MPDQQFASSVTSLYDGTADSVLVAAGAGLPVGQLTAAQLRTLCSVYSTAEVDTAVVAKVSKSGDTMTGALTLPSLIGTGTNGGSSFGTRTIAASIEAGKRLYDVGLRIRTDHNDNLSDPAYPYGSYSALDLDLRSTIYSGGDAMRIFTNFSGVRSKVAYFSNSGAYYTRVGIIVSGSFANHAVNQGEDTTITAPTNDLDMIGVWCDVAGGIQVRAAPGPLSNAWLFEGLDHNAVKRISINPDGAIWWGSTTARTGFDVGLKRASAGVLEINSTVAGTYSDLLLRNLTGSGKVQIGNADTGANKLSVYGAGSSGMAILQNTTTTTATGLAFASATLSGAFTPISSSVSSAGEHKVYLQQNGNGPLLVDMLVLGSTADVLTRYGINGGQNWSAGLDNSDSDAYVISGSSVLGTSNAMRISSALSVNFYGTLSTSAGVSCGAVTYAVLNATTATVGLGEYRVTDRANRRAYPDGTNWRWVADDVIIS